MSKTKNLPQNVSFPIDECSPRCTSILEHLRSQIIAGDLLPGVQLPTRRELEKQYGVSMGTVQQALDRLSQDGFVVADGRRGTHVAEHPPHLSQYALIFRHHPQADRWVWTRFYSALSQEALAANRADHPRIAVRTGIEGHSDNAGFRQLLDDVKAQRLAGMIFADGFGLLEDLPIVQSASTPIVLLGDTKLPHIAQVDTDFDSFYREAYEHLMRKGCKRLAILTHQSPGWPPLERTIESARASGFTILPHWIQHVDVEFSSASANIMSLLMNARDLPDALLITDDNLVEHATSGLQPHMGTHMLEIVAHCNIPHLPASRVPVQFLGFDARVLLRRCLEQIDAMRRGEKPDAVKIGATWANL
jgi:DNA-binding LacI/PurR family transcriptional regulator/DNA-binding transcriptional regulator YhcF (GntR family)